MIKEYFYHYELMNCDFSVELGKHDAFELHQSHGEKGWHITLVNTGEKALKGARIKRIEPYIKNKTFMLTYGDGVADINVRSLLDFHKKHGKTITVTGINASSRFGEMKIKGNKVISFLEKPKTTGSIISGGFFVANTKLFSLLKDDDSCDFETGPLEHLAANNELMVYKHPGSWACMDTLRDTEYLNRLWNEGKAFWKNW
jgi:glucose-1-phosphate cytidylyltransferase